MSSEPTPELSNQHSLQNFRGNIIKEQEIDKIENYAYENKELEDLCNKFTESLFILNSKNYESFAQNNLNIKKVTDGNKGDFIIENSQKKYSLESSPIQTPNNLEKNNEEEEESNEDNNSLQEINNNNNNNDSDSLKNISNEKINNNKISKEISSKKDDSDKENNSLLANSINNKNTPSEKNSQNLSLICKDFVSDLFSQEYTKNINNKGGDELNIIDKEQFSKSKKGNFEQNSEISSNKKSEPYNKDSFKITPEKVKLYLEHKKDIIMIQKNWKTYYDINRFKLLKYKTLIIQNFYRKYLIKKYNLPYNFYYNDKFLKMQTELYEDTYKKNLNILFPSLFMDKSDLNKFASNMLEMANNPIHSPYEAGKIFLFAKILDFDMMIDTNECYETLWASIFDSIYTKCLQVNDPIQLISLGSQHTICVSTKGKVYTFGWNNYGQCGVPINSTIVLKSELENNRLININKFNELELRILNRIDGVKIPQIDEIILSNSITCGEDYTLIVDKEGKLWSFGLNLNGQLGLGHCEQIDKPREVIIEKDNKTFQNSPSLSQNQNQNMNSIDTNSKKKSIYNVINKKKFSLVKSAGYINFCTTEEGNIYMWPWGDKEGNLHYSPKRFFLSSLQEKEKVTSIACGNNFCLILNSNGMVYSMGKSNKYGELGVGDFNPRYGPTPIEFFYLNKERINQISCGFKHSVAKSSTGRVYTWGCGCKGQLGQDNYNNMSIPGFVGFEDPFMKIIQVSAGFRSTFFLSENRKVYACGCNGTISMEKRPILFDIVDKVPEMSLEQNYSVVRINNTWCKSFSIFYATVADTTTMKVSPVKINNILNNLASKWNNENINPPYIESIENYFPNNIMKKPKVK